MGVTVFRRQKPLEILDSRGNPTLAVTVTLGDGTIAPREAYHPAHRPYAGGSRGSGMATRPATAAKAFSEAVGNVNGEIADAISGRTFADIAELDRTLIKLDGTENKARLGANATVGVSMAAARAMAASAGVPLWRALNPPGVTPAAPGPTLQRLEWRGSRAQQAGLPGVHGGADRRPDHGGSRAGRRRGLHGTAQVAYGQGFRDGARRRKGASLPRSTSPRTSST